MARFHHLGTEVYYEDQGSGPALVLICGISADLNNWVPVLPMLTDHYRVITLDNRGVGRTGVPDAPFSIETMADDVRALLDALAVPDAIVVGWSMGGVIAQSLALRHPQRVSRLVLIGSFVEPDGLVREAIGTWVAIRRSDMPFEQVARYIARWVYGPDLAASPERYEKYVQGIIRNPYRQSTEGFVKQAQALLGYRAPEDNPRVPVHVMVGEHDQLTPRYLSEQLQSRYDQATLQVLPGAHAGFIEFPRAYADALLTVLAEPGGT